MNLKYLNLSMDSFKGWNKYGFYKSIVNENMKMRLLHLYKANEFLRFKKYKQIV